MEPSILEYRSPGIAVRRQRWWIVWTTAVVAALVVVLVRVGRSRVTNWMDAGTGTMRWETARFGFVTDSHVDVSPLEKRLTKMGVALPRDWRFIHSRFAGGVECGTAPPIYQGSEVLQTLVNASNDAEILELVAIIRGEADEDAQRKAVDAAIERAFKRSGIN